MGISPARAAAFDALKKIETRHAFSSIVLPQYEERLAATDRSLCHELVLGVLRRQMLLDRVIDELTGARKLDTEVRIALRLGVFQLVYLDRVPPYAAVNDSVLLVARARKSSAKGLVNAVLRKAAQGVLKLRSCDDIERISIETSHPRWLIEKWTKEFGAGMAADLARSNDQAPPLAFRLTAKGNVAALGTNYRRSDVVPGCFIADSMDAHLKRLAEEGEIYFQDQASQMVATAVHIPPGGSFLDVCAAPGGKTGAIALQAFLRPGRSGAGVMAAGDLHGPRARLLRENLEKQGISAVNIVQYDAALGLPFADETLDSILLDAPCSGTGTIRHNPELRYFVKAEDFARLQRTQLAILTGASKLLKPGGSLVYSTCSLEREENEDVIGAFLRENVGFEFLRPDVPDRFVTAGGYARTFPDRDDMDGFFIAELRRA